MGRLTWPGAPLALWEPALDGESYFRDVFRMRAMAHLSGGVADGRDPRDELRTGPPDGANRPSGSRTDDVLIFQHLVTPREPVGRPGERGQLRQIRHVLRFEAHVDEPTAAPPR